MTRKYEIAGWVIIIILLLPVLFYPISTDISVFLQGGKTIISGRKILVNFIDVKPPVLFYFYSIIYLLTGQNDLLLRFADVLYQLVVIASIVFVTNYYLKNKNSALLAGIIYSISYTILQYINTFQIESIISLPLIWLIYFQCKDKKNFVSALIIGGLTGIITSFKYPLGLVLIIIIFDTIRKNSGFKDKLIQLMLIFFGFVIILLFTLIPLLDSEIRKSFGLILKYLAFYNSITPLSVDFFRDSLRKMAYFLGDNISLFLITAFVTGVYKIIGKIDDKKVESEQNNFFYLNLLMILGLFVSIVVERKFLPYHYSRIYVPLSIIAGAGLFSIGTLIIRIWHKADIYQKIIIFFLACLSILFSPVPRWIALAPVQYYFLADKAKYNDFFERKDNLNLYYTQQLQVADELKKYFNRNDKILVVGFGTNYIYNLIEAGNISKFCHPGFYLGNYFVKEWYCDFFNEVKESKWLVIQRNHDFHPLSGHYYDCWQSLQMRPEIYNYVLNNYKLLKEFKDFYIFVKN